MICNIYFLRFENNVYALRCLLKIHSDFISVFFIIAPHESEHLCYVGLFQASVRNLWLLWDAVFMNVVLFNNQEQFYSQVALPIKDFYGRIIDDNKYNFSF